MYALSSGSLLPAGVGTGTTGLITHSLVPGTPFLNPLFAKPGSASFNPSVSLTTAVATRPDRLTVCREFQNGTCSRPEDDCPLAHPPSHIQYDPAENLVTVCMDSVKGKCNRDNCKYFHPPPHLVLQVKELQQRTSQQSQRLLQLSALVNNPLLIPTLTPPGGLLPSNLSTSRTGMALFAPSAAYMTLPVSTPTPSFVMPVSSSSSSQPTVLQSQFTTGINAVTANVNANNNAFAAATANFVPSNSITASTLQGYPPSTLKISPLSPLGGISLPQQPVISGLVSPLSPMPSTTQVLSSPIPLCNFNSGNNANNLSNTHGSASTALFAPAVVNTNDNITNELLLNNASFSNLAPSVALLNATNADGVVFSSSHNNSSSITSVTNSESYLTVTSTISKNLSECSPDFTLPRVSPSTLLLKPVEVSTDNNLPSRHNYISCLSSQNIFSSENNNTNINSNNQEYHSGNQIYIPKTALDQQIPTSNNIISHRNKRSHPDSTPSESVNVNDQGLTNIANDSNFKRQPNDYSDGYQSPVAKKQAFELSQMSLLPNVMPPTGILSASGVLPSDTNVLFGNPNNNKGVDNTTLSFDNQGNKPAIAIPGVPSRVINGYSFPGVYGSVASGAPLIQNSFNTNA